MLKLISLARFQLDCLLAYFKPGARWQWNTPLRLLTRAVYYFCNWSYCLFIYSAEALAFAGQQRLKQVDKALYRHYFYPNQFWIALSEGLKVERPETLYRLTYGETTWFGIRSALKAVAARPDDVFYDLGCGTGRNVFYARLAGGMQAVGIDLLASFVKYGQQVATECQVEHVTFKQQNIFDTPLHAATIVYVTANCYDAETLPMLLQRLEDLPMGARVISTHRPLPSSRLQVIGSKRLPFSWGVDWMYFHQVG